MSKDQKKLIIRNSTAEFLMFTADSHQDGIEVRFQEENVWLSTKMMSVLFDCSSDNIALHLKNIFKEKELEETWVTEDFSATATDGKNYKTKYYNLDAIIAVWYRVNSKRATQFRQWATKVLREFAIKWFILDKERLKNEWYLGRDYFEELLEIIREIRTSERRFYQKITDIYATSLDYDNEHESTKSFFATVQNKLHFAISGFTAAEIISQRADSSKEHMGLFSWKKSPKWKIVKSDVIIAKNYLQKEEIEALDRIANMYLDYAEDQARRNIPMTMSDWTKKLDWFLQFNDRNILTHAGTISSEMAKNFAESEWGKYRITQDRLFSSDFDQFIQSLPTENK